MIQPPSLSANSASISDQCVCDSQVVLLRRFLVGLNEKDDVARERHFAFGELHDRPCKDSHAALEADGAAPMATSSLMTPANGSTLHFSLDTD